MDKREQDLLEKQMRMCHPPAPGNAALTLVGVGFFAAGLVFGSLLFAPTERAEYAASYSPMSFSQHALNKIN